MIKDFEIRHRFVTAWCHCLRLTVKSPLTLSSLLFLFPEHSGLVMDHQHATHIIQSIFAGGLRDQPPCKSGPWAQPRNIYVTPHGILYNLEQFNCIRMLSSTVIGGVFDLCAGVVGSAK